MALLVVGLNHKTAPISLLERLAIRAEEFPKALTQLASQEHVVEGVILSTCNRVEIYANVTRFHAGAQDARNFLAEFRHVAPEDFSDHLYTYTDDIAIAHLFRVAAGLDSMIVGESEILGQVRRARDAALEEGAAGHSLQRVFDHAQRVGKRSRNETSISTASASISSTAVDLARRSVGGTLEDKVVAIVGAGKMGRLASSALDDAREVIVVNRTPERARHVADKVGGRSLGLSQLREALVDADIVISSTNAPEVIVERSIVEEALIERVERVLVFVDIAVPRDIDPAVAELPGVTLLDLDDLGDAVDAPTGRSEIAKVEAIIADELERFEASQQASQLGPAIARLVERAEAVRAAEVGRLGELDPAQKEAVDVATRRLVAKLLHEPLERAKQLADSKQGELYLDSVRSLFGLDDPPED